jgi:predicted nucleotidyltransferase
MRFHGLAEGILASSARVKVIATLLSSPQADWSGSAMARAAGVTPRWAIDTLRLLESHGVVHAARTPPSWRWTVNRRHVLFRGLLPLASLDRAAQAALEKELRRAVQTIRPTAAVWYGSTARGDERPGSDIDLLVVVPRARDKAGAMDALSRHGSRIFWTFGNRLAPAVLSKREFQERRGRPGFVRDALSEGRWIWGAASDA